MKTITMFIAFCTLAGADGFADAYPGAPGVISAFSSDVTMPGGTDHSVNVNWEIDGGEGFIDVSTIDPGDITVSGPAGTLAVTGASPSPNSDAVSILVTYSVQPGGGSWDYTDNGIYTVSTVGNEVLPVAQDGLPVIGNLSQSGIASFTVNIPPPKGIEIQSVASGDYDNAANWDLEVVPVTVDGTHNVLILAGHDMTATNTIEVASSSNAVSALAVNGSLTMSAGELDLGFSTTDYSPRSVDSTLSIGPTGHVTFESCWIYDGYGNVPAGITNQVHIDLAPGGRLISDTGTNGFGMRLWSEWTDATGDGKTWTNNGTDEKDTAPASFEGVLRLLYDEGILTKNGTQSGNFDNDFLFTPGATSADGTLLAVNVSGAYYLWTVAMGLTPGVNDALSDEPGSDGVPNIQHFAFDTHPLTSAGSSEGKIRVAYTDIVGFGYTRFSITLPVRTGATFSGAPSLDTTIDGITYTLQGSANLTNWDEPVYESPTAQADGLPPLRDIDGDGNPDWEYRNFHLKYDNFSQGFLRTLVQ